MKIIVILGIVSLLLYSINNMTTSLETLNQNRISKILNFFTKTNFMAFLTGIFICLITQSSSLITILAISLVNANILKLEKGLAIIIGSNIGTTLISLIISLDIGKFYFFIILLGTFFLICKKKNIANILYNLGLIFLSLDLLEEVLFKGLNESIFISFINSRFLITSGIILGTISSFSIQSSSATIAIAQKLFMNNLISPLLGIAVMMGANIGTTFTGLFLSINTNINAKRLAFGGCIFNVFSVLLFIPILIIYKKPLNHLNFSYLISFSHILFNVITGIIGFLLLPFLTSITKKVIKS